MQETEDIVTRLQNECRATRWTRGVDTDYPVAWEPHPLCAEAATTIATLRAEVQGLRADAERLDWLDGAIFVGRWNGVIGPGSQTTWTIAGDWRHTVYRMVGKDLRAAIDAAKAGKEGA